MIKELTGLRSFFCVLIFLHHFGLYTGGGSLGVAFFFVMSGFSLTLGYGERIKNSEFSFSTYSIRRLIRLFPVHWLCLFFAIPYTFITFQKWQIPEFFANAALVQSWIPKADYFFSFNSVSWYLSDTVFLALIFPFICRFLQRLSSKQIFLFSIIFLAGYATVHTFLFKRNLFQFIYIHPLSRIPDLLIGILLALTYNSIISRKESALAKRLASRGYFPLNGIFILAFSLLILESTLLSDRQMQIAAVYWPLLSITILSAALLGKTNQRNLLNNRLLVWFGNLSFVFYMTHLLVIQYSALIFERCFNLSIGKTWNVLISFAVSLCISMLINRFYEIPISKASIKLLSKLQK